MNGSIIADRITTNVASLGSAVSAFVQAIPVASAWIQRDWLLHSSNSAHVLLTGCKIALLEAGTAWAIGSNRGAAASLRAGVENAFAWLYYKDHPVEFRTVSTRRSDLLLPKAVQAYLKSADTGFETAYNMLSKAKTRPNEYFYSDLSQYVHAHPNFVGAGDIQELVICSPRDQSFLALVRHVDEFISDNYLASYRASWGDFPVVVQGVATARLGAGLSKFVELGA